MTLRIGKRYPMSWGDVGGLQAHGHPPGRREHLVPLAARFRVLTPDRRGHGRTTDVAGPIGIEQMARDTIAFLELVVRGPAHLVGCSDGATVGLLVAWLRPDLAVSSITTAGCSIKLDESSSAALLAIVPGASHGLLVETPELCNAVIVDFPEATRRTFT
jgi:pimeloyl-ACP methyl ester carboxylesterase